jgi:hypothetical protein
MIAAMPDQLMAGIVNDHRRGVSAPASMASTPGAPPPEPRPRGAGWREQIPLGPAPGLKYMDAMMDHQDAKDRAERIVDAAIDRARRGAIAATPTPGSPVQPTPETLAKRPTETTPPPGGHLPKQPKSSV